MLFRSNSGSIRNTENSGNIIGVISAAGGIVGRNANGKGSVIEAFNSGDVSGNGYIGGIVGNNKGGLIEAAANEGNISADQQLAGGIAGYNTNGGKIVNASNKGIITSGNSKGDSFVGGICGFNSDQQPGKDYVIEHFQKYTHKGAIPLIHNISRSNAEALETVIINLKKEGYRFEGLKKLPDY